MGKSFCQNVKRKYAAQHKQLWPYVKMRYQSLTSTEAVSLHTSNCCADTTYSIASCRPDLVGDSSCKCGAVCGWRNRFRGFSNLRFFSRQPAQFPSGGVTEPAKRSPPKTQTSNTSVHITHHLNVIIVEKKRVVSWGDKFHLSGYHATVECNTPISIATAQGYFITVEYR